MFRKNVLPNVKKDVSRSWQETPDRVHEFYSWCAKEAPDASKLPITIFKKERENSLSLIRKIEIDELVIRVTRRILHDWEENLTSFDHIDCVEHVTDHRWMGVWFTVDLIHPNHGHSELIRNFTGFICGYQYITARHIDVRIQTDGDRLTDRGFGHFSCGKNDFCDFGLLPRRKYS